jgi:hypothetical protein
MALSVNWSGQLCQLFYTALPISSNIRAGQFLLAGECEDWISIKKRTYASVKMTKTAKSLSCGRDVNILVVA